MKDKMKNTIGILRKDISCVMPVGRHLDKGTQLIIKATLTNGNLSCSKIKDRESFFIIKPDTPMLLDISHR